MSISLATARELQHRVRVEPQSAPAIVGDLIAAVNGQCSAFGTPLSNHAPARCPVPYHAQQYVETPEQREQRLLNDLIAVRKDKEAASEAAKAEEAKQVRLDAIDRATALSTATTDVLQAIRSQVDYNSGDVVSRDTWWKFRKELAPVVAVHGFKLVNVGTKSKPKAALAEV